MKKIFKENWRWMILASIFYFVFLAYYTQASFSKKLSPLSLIVEETSATPSSTDMNQEKINSPVRLRIPAAGIDTEIEYVGLTSAGEMDVPEDADHVAWFSLGFLPGEEGSAVMAGHLDDKNGQAAVFYNLKELIKDDKLFVEDGQGGITTFVVRETRVYNSETFTPEIFISNEGRHLNLITCAGSWNKSEGEYRQRLVVFADIDVF